MKASRRHLIAQTLDIGYEAFLPFFDGFSEGLLIVDRTGSISHFIPPWLPSTNSPVMLYGETGTGKELFAQAIHNHSGRKISRYTAVNCAAIPENLLEGLLFGTTSGAFTGVRNKLELFERASGSLWGGAAIAFPFIFATELVRSSLTNLPGLNLLLYGLLLILVMIYYPGGFAQFFDTYIRKPKNRMMDYFLNGAYGSAG